MSTAFWLTADHTILSSVLIDLMCDNNVGFHFLTSKKTIYKNYNDRIKEENKNFNTDPAHVRLKEM